MAPNGRPPKLTMLRTESYGRPSLPTYLAEDGVEEDDYSEDSFDCGMGLTKRSQMEEAEGEHFIHRFQYEGL